MKKILLAAGLCLIAESLIACAPLTPEPASVGIAKDVGFPGQISLAALAQRPSDGPARPALASRAPECPFEGNDRATSERAFNELVDRLRSEGVLDRVLPLEAAQRKEAFELVQSGRFKGDILHSLQQVYRTDQELPLRAVAAVPKTPETAVRLPTAFLADLQDDRLEERCAGEFRNFLQPGGEVVLPAECRPELLSHTLQTLYENPTAAGVADTARIFVERDNRTLRLAILAYARLNGMHITEENLDDLEKALSREHPDLYPLVVGGLKTMADEYGLKDIRGAAEKLKAFDASCGG